MCKEEKLVLIFLAIVVLTVGILISSGAIEIPTFEQVWR